MACQQYLLFTLSSVYKASGLLFAAFVRKIYKEHVFQVITRLSSACPGNKTTMSANHPSKVFSCVPSGPPDPMNDLAIRIKADSSSSKIDLGAGVYRGEDSSKPFVLSAIVKVFQKQEQVINDVIREYMLIRWQAKAILASNDPGHEVFFFLFHPQLFSILADMNV